jgi:AraC-like DNA-binding protein
MIAINFYLGYHSLIQRKEVLKAYYSGLAIDEIPQAAIFTVATVETKVSGDLDSRYTRSSLKAESRINIIQQLNRLMQEEELFTDTKLCIDDVALRLSINSKYLSQSINEEYNRNFYVYVNELRVEKAKTYLVAEPQANYSIEGIARQVGFQSKSSFYIAFRRSTGLTPTAYRAQA